MLYADIIREIAVRVNAVAGNTPAEKSAALAASPLTAAQIGSVDFPFSTIQRAALSAVGRVYRLIANLKSHPFRNQNLSQTAEIESGEVIPGTNAAGVKIVGAYGAIREAATGKILTEQPEQLFDSIARSLEDGSLKRGVRYYKIAGERLYHTVEAATIDVVAFDFASQQTAMNAANGETPIPDALFDVVWCAALAFLVTDDSYLQQAAMAESYVQGELNQLAAGAISFKPAPDLVNTNSSSVS